MYGHAGRKNVYGKEIKLVRVRAFDSRVQENSVRRGGGLQGKTVKRGDGRVNVRAVKSGGGRMYARTAKSGGGRMYARTAKSGDGRVHGRAVECGNGGAGRSVGRRMSLLAGIIASAAAGLLLAGFLKGIFLASQKAAVVAEEGSMSFSAPQAEPPTVSANDIILIEEEPAVPVIVIDPGHGGEDDGCCRGEVTEKAVNLQIALKLAQKLEGMGYETVLTRGDDETMLTLEQRVEIAEAAGGDIFISIHQNACEEKESPVTGIETWFSGCPEKEKGANWYCDCCDDSRRLAQLVQMGAVSLTGANDRGLLESQELYVIRETSMPSCLIETAFLSNKTERNAISSEDYQNELTEGIARNIDYYFHPKTMYLTFDDGPSEENTAAVLDILQERGIKATFFVVGENVRKNPDIARRIVAEGHTIGIHCYSHDYEEIYKSVDAYLADFQEAFDTVYEVTGVEVQLFRFPGGSINAYNEDLYEEIIEEMTGRGFTYFDWNASLEDAVGMSAPEELLQNARESTLGRKKIVMLAHDIVYNTTLCLERLIDQFPDYKMEPLTADVAPICF